MNQCFSAFLPTVVTQLIFFLASMQMKRNSAIIKSRGHQKWITLSTHTYLENEASIHISSRKKESERNTQRSQYISEKRVDKTVAILEKQPTEVLCKKRCS